MRCLQAKRYREPILCRCRAGEGRLRCPPARRDLLQVRRIRTRDLLRKVSPERRLRGPRISREEPVRQGRRERYRHLRWLSRDLVARFRPPEAKPVVPEAARRPNAPPPPPPPPPKSVAAPPRPVPQAADFGGGDRK